MALTQLTLIENRLVIGTFPAIVDLEVNLFPSLTGAAFHNSHDLI